MRHWLANPRTKVLATVVVAPALIPVAIGFSMASRLDPKVSLSASLLVACVIAFTGGRPATISATTASITVLMTELVPAHRYNACSRRQS